MLNPKQAQFAIEYAISGNATQAAIKAGYSKKTASVKGSSLLKIVKVQEAIANIKTEQAEKNDVTVAEITAMHREAYRVASDVQVPSAMTAAAQNLAKLHGLITDKGQIEYGGGLTVNITKFGDDDS